MSGIYIHIPFCRQACSYCDFHFTVNPKGVQRFLNSLHKEIELRSQTWRYKNIDTIYFGGGTPSVLKIHDIEKILIKLKSTFNLSKVSETTLEMNPEDAGLDYLEGLKNLGFNRLSLGLQSMDDEELKWMNRAHNSQKNILAVQNAKKAGFNNISVDLIFGSRFQNVQSLETTLQQIFELNIQHISPYHLTIEENTPLGKYFARGKEPEPDENLAAEQYAIIMQRAEENDFIQYEISNFGKEGFFSKHNSSYWKNIPYLGLGPSAHSYDGIKRMHNISSNANYTQMLEKDKFQFETENLSEREKINENILIGLRTIWGLDISKLQLNGVDEEIFMKKVKEYERSAYLNLQGNNVTLTKEGRKIADRIMSDLFF